VDIPRKVQYQRSTADAYVTGSETDYRYEDGDEGKGIDLSSEYEYEEDVLPTTSMSAVALTAVHLEMGTSDLWKTSVLTEMNYGNTIGMLRCDIKEFSTSQSEELLVL